MSNQMHVVLVTLSVDAGADFNLPAVRDSIFHGINRQRNEVGLTADSDEESMVTAFDVLDGSTVFSIVSREPSNGAENIQTRGIKVDHECAMATAKEIADKLAIDYQTELARDVAVCEISDNECISGGYALSIEDEGNIAFVEIHRTQIS